MAAVWQRTLLCLENPDVKDLAHKPIPTGKQKRARKRCSCGSVLQRLYKRERFSSNQIIPRELGAIAAV